MQINDDCFVQAFSVSSVIIQKVYLLKIVKYDQRGW